MKDHVLEKHIILTFRDHLSPLDSRSTHLQFSGVLRLVSWPPEFFFRRTSGGASRTPPYQFIRRNIASSGVLQDQYYLKLWFYFLISLSLAQKNERRIREGKQWPFVMVGMTVTKKPGKKNVKPSNG